MSPFGLNQIIDGSLERLAGLNLLGDWLTGTVDPDSCVQRRFKRGFAGSACPMFARGFSHQLWAHQNCKRVVPKYFNGS